MSEFGRDNRALGRRAPRGGMGVASSCKSCVAEARSPGISQARAEKERRRAQGEKWCGKCEQWKPFSEFHVRRASPDGLAYRCIDCVVETCRAWRDANPGAFKDWHAEHRDERRQYTGQWCAENREHRQQAYSRWARENSHVVNALVARRAAAKLQATPIWADEAAIRTVYAEAKRLTAETGVRHEVDHYYPLQGELVCGLHCEANLRVVTKAENQRKKNRMPEELYEA